MKRTASFTLALLACIPLVGCGGGSSPLRNTASSSLSGGDASRATGHAILRVKWPARSTSRLIPLAANSVKISVTNNGVEFASTVLVRPTGGGAVASSYTFANLPPGALTATATAFASADATGTAQATGTAPLVITANLGTPLTLTMNSTVATMTVTGAATLNQGATETLTATAKNAAGDIVLVDAGALSWVSSDKTKASIDAATGIATGLAIGPTTITATYQEGGASPVSGTFNLTVGKSAYLYVADTQDNRIVKLDSSGKFIASYMAFGPPTGTLSAPYATAFDSAGNIYISDTGNNRVLKLSSGGAALLEIGAGTLSFPASIALDGSDNLYVADTGNGLLAKFDSSGNALATYGDFGKNGKLNHPYGVAVSGGNVYVSDYDSSAVFKLDLSGNFVASYSNLGAAGGSLSNPAGVALDSAGNLYIADVGNNRIVKLDSAGNFAAAYTTFTGAFNSLNSPSGVTVDSSGNIYIADTLNNEVVELDAQGAFVTAYTNSVIGGLNQPSSVAIH